MTAVTDSVIFGNILSTAECASIWSDTTRTMYYLKFEACLARAQAEVDIIPSHAANEIEKACRLEVLDFDKLRKDTELIGYPVLPVVRQLVSEVNKVEAGLGEWAHYGATTQDITDTATILQLKDTLDLVEKSLGGIIATLRKLCEEYKTTPMAARSNLQQAVPITFGFKLARLLATFERHAQRLKELRPRVQVIEFSGAAGTLATLSPQGNDKDKVIQCQQKLAAHLGLQTPEIAWHTERDRIAEVGYFFSLLTGTCAKFAMDMKLLMQTEVGEAAEPYAPHRGSSSTMPQKRNPIASAYITAAAASVRNLSNALGDAMVEDHERSTGPWEIEWIVLPQICPLTHATLVHTLSVLEGLEVSKEAMARNLELTNGAIVSEHVMMGLSPVLGRQKAHDIVYDLCHKAVRSKRSLLDVLDEDEQIDLPRDELAKLCDPANYLGLSVHFTEAVLKSTSSK